MHLILAGLGFWSTVLLAVAAAGGRGWIDVGPLHPLVGIFAGLLAVLTHSLLFIHLIGSGRAIKETVKDREVDPAFVLRAKRMKARAFPLALLAILLVGALVISGGWSRGGVWPVWIHGLLSALGLLAHVAACVVSYRVTRDNGELVAEVEEAAARPPSAAAPDGPDAKEA